MEAYGPHSEHRGAGSDRRHEGRAGTERRDEPLQIREGGRHVRRDHQQRVTAAAFRAGHRASHQANAQPLGSRWRFPNRGGCRRQPHRLRLRGRTRRVFQLVPSVRYRWRWWPRAFRPTGTSDLRYPRSRQHARTANRPGRQRRKGHHTGAGTGSRSRRCGSFRGRPGRGRGGGRSTGHARHTSTQRQPHHFPICPSGRPVDQRWAQERRGNGRGPGAGRCATR